MSTTPVTTAVLAVDELVDITAKYDANQDFFTVRNVSYSCCCHMDANKTDVACELVDVLSKPVHKYKHGCGAMKGDGYHSWYNMQKHSKYKRLPHAGKCAVPAKEFQEKVTAIEEELVDFTEQFDGEQKSFVSNNATYQCCCQLDSSKIDVTCELIDVTNTSVKKCGSLMGAGFHSWYNMKKQRKYKDLEHAGKCVVPWKNVEAVSTTTTTTTATSTTTAEATTTVATTQAANATVEEDA
jgi:hypothetical protein